MPCYNTLKTEFISFMIECAALLFGEFKLKSGRISPYFINTGEYKTGAQMAKLGGFYARLIRDSVDGAVGVPSFSVLFGPAYKGIPLVTAAATKLSEAGIDLNISFNRKERKDHGEGSLIMGYVPRSGDKIAIIEDVTTAGTSIRETMSLLEELEIDAQITALYISIDRMERGTGELTAIAELRRELGIDLHSIATTADIIDYLENTPAGCIQVPEGKHYAENIRKYLAQYGGVDG